MFAENRIYGVHNVGEPDPAGVEGRDGFLIGGVEHRRVRAPLPRRVLGEIHCRECRHIQGLEGPGGCLGPVARGGRLRHPVRPAQPQRDGEAHVRRRCLRDDGPVNELDH